MQGRTGTLVNRLLWPATLLLSLVLYVAVGMDDAVGRCDGGAEVPLSRVSGLGGESLDDGDEVLVGGIVTGVFLGAERLDGFFLQAEEEDGPAALFVYAPRLDTEFRQWVRPGVRLQVSGRRGTWRGQPQLQRVEGVRFCGEPGKPEAVSLALPADDERLRALSGVLVEFPESLTVTGNHTLGRFGSLDLAAERLYRQRSGIDDDGVARMVLDDGSYRSNPDPVPFLDELGGTRRTGDRVGNLRGILVHQFDDWRLHPVVEPEFEVANPRPAEPVLPPGLRVAAVNVENYFVTLGERGAGSPPALDRQRAKLLPALAALDADLLALVEVENRPAALQDLLEHLNRVVDRRYARLDGSVYAGTDAIRVAWLYRPDRLQPLGSPASDAREVHHRAPVVAAFQPVDGGEPFLAAVVHFKSKIRCPERGDVDRGEGCWNQRRMEQARALVGFVDRESRRRGVEQVLLAGDFNSYAAERPIRLLERAGYRNVIAGELPPERHYTYVFRGASGMLDYLFVNEALSDRVTGAEVWHINADEPSFLGYDAPGGDSPASRGLPFRSSDHDPVMLGLEP